MCTLYKAANLLQIFVERKKERKKNKEYFDRERINSLQLLAGLIKLIENKIELIL